MKASYQGITLEGTADEVVSALTKLMKAEKPHYVYPYPWWGSNPPTVYPWYATSNNGYVKAAAINNTTSYNMTSPNNSAKAAYLTPITYTQAE